MAIIANKTTITEALQVKTHAEHLPVSGALSANRNDGFTKPGPDPEEPHKATTLRACKEQFRGGRFCIS